MPVGQWFNETTLHPIAFIAVLVLGTVMFIAPRRYALLPLLAVACFIASAQVIVVATLDFNLLRIMVLIGWMRVVLRREYAEWRFKTLDGAVIAWVVVGAAASTLLHMTFPAFIQRLGNTYDAIGIYFLCRLLVRNWSDVRAFVQGAAVMSLPVAALFLMEKTTGRNIFSIFGGVPETTVVRLGHLRCQGPFAHPIMAGCFWAALAPMMWALWFYRGWNRLLAAAGVAACLVVVITCASATPLNGALFALLALALFPLRRWMSWIRWAVVLGAVAVQLAMISPIWHLMVRMDFVGGATGWYRSRIIDEFIRHFGDWWLVGTEGYPNWFPLGHTDIANQYILQGLEGGLLTLLLFAAIIIIAFADVGRICRRAERRRYRLQQAPAGPSRASRLRIRRIRHSAQHVGIAWALGAALLVQCVVFTGTSYFGHTLLIWFVNLALIGSLAPARQLARRAVVRLTPPRSDQPLVSRRMRAATHPEV